MIYILSLALLLATASVSAMSTQSIPLDSLDISNLTLMIPSSQVRTQNIKGKIDLLYHSEGFIIKKDETFKRVHSYDTDTLLRHKDINQIVTLAACLSKFKVSQLDNGDFILRAHTNIKGGGPGGATVGFWAGKAAVYFVGHGTITIVSTLAGPAAPALAGTLESIFAPWIEAASNVVGVGVAVVSGTASGPI